MIQFSLLPLMQNYQQAQRLLVPPVQWLNPQQLQTSDDRIHLHPQANQLIAPVALFETPSLPDAPGFRQAGDTISALAERYGYRRGQPIHDKRVIQALFDKAGEIYGIPGDYLYRVSIRESGGKHWDSKGNIRHSAAVGVMQIEKSAHPNWVQGGIANARNNAYDLGNNIAMGAQVIRGSLDRLIKKSGYRGSNPWRDLSPLLDISYNAGSGALALTQRIARSRGLDPFNWRHLLFGRDISLPTKGKFQIQGSAIEQSPAHQAMKQIHERRVQQGRPRSYPIYWNTPAAIRRFDFDGNGVATKAERLISRIIYTQTGHSLQAR